MRSVEQIDGNYMVAKSLTLKVEIEHNALEANCQTFMKGKKQDELYPIIVEQFANLKNKIEKAMDVTNRSMDLLNKNIELKSSNIHEFKIRVIKLQHINDMLKTMKSDIESLKDIFNRYLAMF